MVCAAVHKLGGSDINDPFSCPVRNQVHKAEKILTGIPKAHPPANTGFIIGSGTGHVKRHHTLILVPDIYHAVNLFVGRSDGIFPQKFLPVLIQLLKRLFHISVRLIPVKQRIGRLLVDHPVGLPLIFHRIFNIGKNKYKGSCFTGS